MQSKISPPISAHKKCAMEKFSNIKSLIEPKLREYSFEKFHGSPTDLGVCVHTPSNPYELEEENYRENEIKRSIAKLQARINSGHWKPRM